MNERLGIRLGSGLDKIANARSLDRQAAGL
jgi:hypothetical protein